VTEPDTRVSGDALYEQIQRAIAAGDLKLAEALIRLREASR
jgi:hypothetical protein